jgi:hypothetical protein
MKPVKTSAGTADIASFFGGKPKAGAKPTAAVAKGSDSGAEPDTAAKRKAKQVLFSPVQPISHRYDIM